MKLYFLILLSLLFVNVAIAEPSLVVNQQAVSLPITQAQNVTFENCSKMFPTDKEKLFYLTLSAITANKFSINEIQTNHGYIIFSVANNKYLATIAGIDTTNAILKITPCNEVYFFPPGILINMFKYIELNLNVS